MSHCDEPTRKLHEDTTDYVQDFLNIVLKYAREFIQNTKLRKEYITLAKTSASGFLEHCEAQVAKNVSNAREIWYKAAKDACKMRNKFLNLTRNKMSELSVAFSKMVKDEGLTFQQLIDKYTKKLFGIQKFASLTEKDQQKVFNAIIEASGKTNRNVNAFNLWVSRASKVFMGVTVFFSIYFICKAENPMLEMVKKAVSYVAGCIASDCGTKLGMFIGSCGGPIGIFIGAFVGGALFCYLGNLYGETLVDALHSASSADTGPPQLCVKMTIDAGPSPFGEEETNLGHSGVLVRQI